MMLEMAGEALARKCGLGGVAFGVGLKGLCEEELTSILVERMGS